MESSSSSPAKKTRVTDDSVKKIEPEHEWNVGYKVSCVAFSPNGEHVVSLGTTVSVYNVLTGEFVFELEGRESWIYTVAYTPDGKYIISGSWDHLIKLWNASTGKLEAILEGHIATVNVLAISEDGKILYSSSWDHTIRKWDLENKTCLGTWEVPTDSVLSLAITPDMIISGLGDKTVKCRNRTTGECNQTINDHTGVVVVVASNPNPESSLLFATGSLDDTIKLYDDRSSCTRTLEGHSSWVTSLSFNKNGSLLASGSNDHTVKIWNLSDGICLHTMRVNFSPVLSVVFSPDGSQLVSGHGDGTICVWKMM